MFFLDGLDESSIWSIGDFAGRNRGKAAMARAQMLSGVMTKLGLIIEPDSKDHPLHINVGPWPTSKDEQKAIALELCVSSTLFVRNP